MSDYGADADPNMRKAIDLAYTKGLLPLDKTNVMQWTYPSGVVVRKLAHRKTGSNILIKFGLTPVPAGNACTVCWGNDRPFGVGETPGKVTVVIEGIEKTPAWIPPMFDQPDGAFELTQNILQACTYQLDNANFDMDLVFTPGDATFVIRQVGGPTISFRSTKSVCATFFENEETVYFVNGTATIFIPPIL